MKFSSQSILFLLLTSCPSGLNEKQVSTFAGNNSFGFINGHSSEAAFSNPSGIVVDNKGNVYVADSHNHAVRKVDRQGMVTTLAGNGNPGKSDGQGEKASFFFPTALAVDVNDNVFVADTRNNLIRKITPTGVVKTIGDKGTLLFDNPEGIAVDLDGNIFVADWSDQIHKIDLQGNVSVFAGTGNPGLINGERSQASFYIPRGIVFDSDGNLYVSDSFNNCIRKISKNGKVSVLAGSVKKGLKNGRGDSALFFHPYGIAIDHNKNIYVADVGNQMIRKVDVHGNVTTVSGTGERGVLNGDISKANFWNPIGIAVTSDKHILITDNLNNLIRQIIE